MEEQNEGDTERYRKYIHYLAHNNM